MIMEKISSGEEVGGAGGAYSYSALKRLDQIWSSICEAQGGMPPDRQNIICNSSSEFIVTEMVRVRHFDHTWSSYVMILVGRSLI